MQHKEYSLGRGRMIAIAQHPLGVEAQMGLQEKTMNKRTGQVCAGVDRIIQGDCLEEIKKLPDESVDCVVTSPPYWALRDYGVEGQFGLEPTFQEYITKLCDIFDEIKRVLKKEGTCFVNLGDSYIGSPAGKTKPSGFQQEHSALNGDYQPTIHKFADPKNPASLRAREQVPKQSLPNKSLCQIPNRFAIEMQDRGWILRNEIIWHKPNAMPSSVKDRFTIDFEKVFFFVKNKKYYFEQQRQPHKEVSLNRIKKPWRGNLTKGHALGGLKDGDMSKMCHPDGRNMRTVWSINTASLKEAHFATYPEALIEPMIKAGCPMGGVVLDPFMGAGTTGLVARKQDKNYIGIELNMEYIEIAERRIAGLPPKLFTGLKQDNTGNPTYTGFNK